MNTTGLMALADHIEANTSRTFNMSTYSGCFLGFNADMLKWPTIDMVNPKSFAAHYEITVDQARSLCWGDYPLSTNLRYVSREQGVRTLRHFAGTGMVDFTIGQ